MIILLANLLVINLMAQVSSDNLVVNQNNKAVFTVPRTQVTKVEFNKSLPIDMVNFTVLCNGVKFDLLYGEDVVAYNAYVVKNYGDNKSRSDQEWIDMFEKTPSKYRIDLTGKSSPRKNNLSANTEYLLLIQPIDKDNHVGTLTRRVFKTPKASSQPEAIITSVTKSDYDMQWTTEKGSKCAAYYMLVHVGDQPLYSDWSDVDIAFYINKNKKDLVKWSDFGDFRQLFKNNDKYFEVITYGIDEEGNFSGIVNKYIEAPESQASSNKISSMEMDLPTE